LVINYSNLLLFNLGNPITVVSYILRGNGNEFWITFLITLHLMYLADESNNQSQQVSIGEGSVHKVQ